MTRTVQALVLHKQWSGDTSARVYFFTRELGLIYCLCKGGRTPKKQSLLQAFTPIWLSLDERYGQFFVRSMECTQARLEFSGSALFSALYVNELLYYVLKQGSVDVHLFDAYWATLQALSKQSERLHIEALLRRFEWTLIKACGYAFSWTQEAGGKALIQDNVAYRFVLGEGFIAQAQGIPGSHILAIAQDNLQDAAYLKSAKIIMRQAIDHLVGGREIRARSLMKV